MAAGTHIVGTAHSSSSTSPPSPLAWHPVILVPNNHPQQQQHQVLYDDLDHATPPSSTFQSPPRPRHNSHHHLRPAAPRRRAGKQQPRRPRPSRKLPTTYISADAASFRRMVHQVTGADDVHLPAAEVLCRQAPAPHSRAGFMTATRTARTETLLLPPTLDTSAFLMLGAAGGSGGGADAAPARPAVAAVLSCCHGSAAASVADPELGFVG